MVRIGDLRKELRSTFEDLLGGTVGKLQKHELIHRIDILKKAAVTRKETPEPDKIPMNGIGARNVPTTTATINADSEPTAVTKPIAPTDESAAHPFAKGWTQNRKSKASKAATVTNEATTETVEKKSRKKVPMPPKVVLEEASEPEEPKPSETSEAPKAKVPKAPKAATESEVSEKPKRKRTVKVKSETEKKEEKLPGGVRLLPESQRTVYFN